MRLPGIIRGALGEWSREVRGALRSLEGRVGSVEGRIPPHPGVGYRFPFAAIPQGDDTVKIAPGSIFYHEGNNPMEVKTIDEDWSAAITVADGETVFGHITMTRGGASGSCEQIATSATGGETHYTYHSKPVDTTWAYTATAPTETVADMDSTASPTNWELYWPIAKFDVAAGVATINTQHQRGNIILPYVSYHESTS